MLKNHYAILFLSLILSGCAQNFKSTTGEEYPFQIQTFLKDQPSPTVLISHGSACLVRSSAEWAQQFNSWGYNAISIDHCTPRGVSSYTGEFPPKNLTAVDKAKDYAALAKWVQTQTWHSGGIAVIGFSRGGAGVFMFANEDLLLSTKSLNKDQLKLVSVGIAYYPGCTPNNPPKNPHLPVLVHHGLSDNLSNPTYCNYESLTDPNYQIVLYPNVHHTFDTQGPDILGSNAFGKHVVRRYDRDADIKARMITKQFLDKYINSSQK
jgi:dienelactone hydrolase